MEEKQRRRAVEDFARRWRGRGYEKGESQSYWIELLRDVLGVERPTEIITFEERVRLDHTSFIDGYITPTKVLIEQKGLGKDLRKPIRQSDGSVLTPFQQAKRYSAELPYSERPRWIVTCNFASLLVYDMEQPGGEPYEIQLERLPEEYYRLRFLVDPADRHVSLEAQVSLQAGEIVARLYAALQGQYHEPDAAETLRSLNVLCVRLVFCLYAEDAGILGRHGMFHDYLARQAADPGRDHISLPNAPAGGLEDAYRQALEVQTARAAGLRRAGRAQRDDLLDYFAAWAHQVKTPLAAMRLLVQNRADPAELEPELFRTEGYVEAAMGYLRLGADSRDLALRPTALDPVVRRSLRRYARMFILGRLRLSYDGAPAAARPVTDEKWVGFILEQLLSNAVKYTPPGGTVTVQADEHALQVSDTGPGVLPSDLPRLFEKGYTGANGRAAGAVSTGMGLYLCARAAARMGCTLDAANRPGGGCTFTLHFPGPQDLYE